MKNLLLIFASVYKISLESTDNRLTKSVAFYRGTKWGSVKHGNKLCDQMNTKNVTWFVDDIRKVY